MKVLAGAAQLSSRLLAPLQQVCCVFFSCIFYLPTDDIFLQARPLSSSAVRMDQSYRIEADTFGELKVNIQK